MSAVIVHHRQGEPSSALRERVAAARAIQAKRFTSIRLRTNADMGPTELRRELSQAVREFRRLADGSH